MPLSTTSSTAVDDEGAQRREAAGRPGGRRSPGGADQAADAAVRCGEAVCVAVRPDEPLTRVADGRRKKETSSPGDALSWLCAGQPFGWPVGWNEGEYREARSPAASVFPQERVKAAKPLVTSAVRCREASRLPLPTGAVARRDVARHNRLTLGGAGSYTPLSGVGARWVPACPRTLNTEQSPPHGSLLILRARHAALPGPRPRGAAGRTNSGPAACCSSLE
jgi:hypothetical protein